VRILIVTFYYPPDLSAGSFRVDAIVKALQSHPDLKIDVVSTRPNRYGSFFAEAPRRETNDRLEISRIPVRKHKSGMFDQPVTFLKFALGALREVRGRKYDLVFATSSRLMTAALGALIARRLRTKLYLDIRDIFSDTIREIAPRPISILSAPFFAWLERWTVLRANTIALVSPGFADYFRQHYPGKRLVFFTNGVDDDFTHPPAAGPGNSSIRTVVYAGNIGEGQGLEVILPELAELTTNEMVFRVIGDGGRKQALADELAKRGIKNVELVAPLKRDALVRAYAEADVLFLHLNSYTALEKVLPSKIFEYAATGKPIVAGVSGYSAEFIRSEVSNAEVFTPGVVRDALAALRKVGAAHTDRSSFVAKYRRSEISRKMADDILAVAAGREVKS
jgi:glycosyltransferase involved in cell wall biosynthesis